MQNARALLRTMETAADVAAGVIRSYESRRSELDWREKGTSDFVTEVDVAAEQVVGSPGTELEFAL